MRQNRIDQSVSHKDKYCFVKFWFQLCVCLVFNVKPIRFYGLHPKMFKSHWTLNRGRPKGEKNK